MHQPATLLLAPAKAFNPSQFDAKAIVWLAKDAGMKNITITSKHHEGFAMFHSEAVYETGNTSTL